MLTIRTGIAECLDESAHTSIAARLAEMQGQPFVPVQAAVLPGKGAAMAPQAGPPGAEPTPARLIALAAQRQTRTLRGLAAARRVFEGGGAVQRGAA